MSAQPPLGSPYGRAGERSETERAYAVSSLQIGGEIATGYPLCLDYHPPSNRVTPNGVGQPPGSQTRHCQRVQPALSVMTLFSYLRLRTPSQSRLRPLALPKGEPRGGRCPPNASKSPGATRPLSHGCAVPALP